MSNYQNKYAGGTPQVDEYGNPIGVDEHGRRAHTDQYGNPTQHVDTSRYGTGTGGFDSTTLQGMRPADATVPTHGRDYRHDQQQQQQQGLSGGMLHRSGSSSSDEDDGMGGGRRKKKGLKEKIPGVGRKHDIDDPYQQQQQAHYTTTNPPGYYEYEGQQQPHQEKKGVMEKIKEKLPGHH